MLLFKPANFRRGYTLSPSPPPDVSSSRHARQSLQRPMDLSILRQPSTSTKSPVSYTWYSDHPDFGCTVRWQHLLSSPVGICFSPLSSGMDFTIRRPRVRRQTSGIFSRLAIPLRRRSLVVGEDSRQSLNSSVPGNHKNSYVLPRRQ